MSNEHAGTTGFQAEGGAYRRQERSNAGSTRGAARGASQSDRGVEAQLASGGVDAFGPALPAIDVKSLHAKIVELTVGRSIRKKRLRWVSALSVGEQSRIPCAKQFYLLAGTGAEQQDLRWQNALATNAAVRRADCGTFALLRSQSDAAMRRSLPFYSRLSSRKRLRR